MAASVWTYPIIGMFIGACSGGILVSFGWLGFPPSICALMAIATSVLLTGAMHEDGLADTADGLGGGRSKSERLKIMKDSQVGAYGVIAVFLVLGIRWAGLFEVAQIANPFWILVSVGAISRLPMAVFMRVLPTARESGLSKSVGRPPLWSVILCLVLALVISVSMLGLAGIWLIIGSFMITAPLIFVSWKLIGGQTGDILGACQQVTEAGLVLALLWACVQLG